MKIGIVGAGFIGRAVARLAEGWRFERARPAYCVPLDRAGLELAEADKAQQREGAWRE